MLEQGRSVLWVDILDLHTDLTALHQAAGHLAARLEACRAALDGLPSEASGEE
jgi:hypothetical protein